MIPVSIRLTTEITPDMSPSGSYVFPCHPHGALAFNRAAVGFCMSDLWDAAFPQFPNLKVLVASAAFYVPIVRELWLASYCIEASKKVAVAAIKRGGRGTAVLVYPGGETEQLLTVRGRERVYLSGRKGFIKLALERGCEVCPVYAFGESDLYEHSQLFIGLRRTIQKKFGAAVPLIYGQIGLLPYFPPNGVKLVWGGERRVRGAKRRAERPHLLETGAQLQQYFLRSSGPIGLFKGRKWKEGFEVTQAMIDDGHTLYVAKLKEVRGVSEECLYQIKTVASFSNFNYEMDKYNKYVIRRLRCEREHFISSETWVPMLLRRG